MDATTYSAQVFEGQALYAVARLVRSDGEYVQQSDVQDITAFIYNRSEPSSPFVSREPLAVTDTIFDTLQTDGFWDGDRLGYNFRGRLRPGVFSAGATSYRAEIIVRLYDQDAGSGDDTDNIPIVYDIAVLPLQSE